MANVVRRVVIEELYDKYSYDINFHKDGVTLITGPNGYGKTTVLNIIKNALDQNFFYFFDLLFKSVILYFDDSEKGNRLIIKKTKAKQESFFDEESIFDIVIEFYNGDVKKPTDSFTINRKFMNHSRDYLQAINDFYFIEEDNYRRRYVERNNKGVMQHFKNF